MATATTSTGDPPPEPPAPTTSTTTTTETMEETSTPSTSKVINKEKPREVTSPYERLNFHLIPPKWPGFKELRLTVSFLALL